MKLLTGHILNATSGMDDPFFKGASIFITEHNDKGATGFVFNKPSGRYLNELEEFSYCKPVPLYDGGPVDKEHLFFVHIRPDVIEEGISIGNGIYVGGNFTKATGAINEGSINTTQIKIFIGYCGWDTGEFEAEIAEGSWEVTSFVREEVMG